MVSENLKIHFDNLNIFERYQDLLFNAMQASSGLDSAISSTMGYGSNVPHNQLFKKVENDARTENNMLYDKLSVWKMDWSEVDKNNVIAVGDYYKYVYHDRNAYLRDTKVCTLFHIIKIEYPDNHYEVCSNYEGKVTVFFETIHINEQWMKVQGKNIDRGEYARNENMLLEPFVAYVLSGKYKKIEKSEWDKALSYYNEGMNIYNHFIEKDNGEAEE